MSIEKQIYRRRRIDQPIMVSPGVYLINLLVILMILLRVFIVICIIIG
jgi:hypothetical protein